MNNERGSTPAAPVDRAARWPYASRLLRVGGAALGVLSCVPMVAMLPGAVAALLTTLGISVTTGPWAALSSALEPVARPLLILGLVMLLVGALRCGRGPAILVAVGGSVVYVSMYSLTAPMTSDMAPMAGSSGVTNGPAFYGGLISIGAAFAWSSVRRRRRTCRPVWTLSRSTA